MASCAGDCAANTASSPAVSVILPSYNAWPFIAGAVESILGQTFGDLELLAVDGGSTDGTIDYLRDKAAADRRIRLLENVGGGLIGALEAGRRLARAPYIARMDADDISRPDRIELQVKALQSRASVVVIGGQIDIIDANGRFVRKGYFPVKPEACVAHLQFAAPLCHPAAMMRRSALEAVGGYRSEAYLAEDFDLWLRLADHGQIANLAETVLDYRVHDRNSTQLLAHANGVAVALSRLFHRSGDTSAMVQQLRLQETWEGCEALLPAEHRLQARADYLGATAVTGGIVQPGIADLFIKSMPAFAADPQIFGDGSRMAFAALRGSLNLLRDGQTGTAVSLILSGLRYAPVQMIRDIFRRALRR